MDHKYSAQSMNGQASPRVQTTQSARSSPVGCWGPTNTRNFGDGLEHRIESLRPSAELVPSGWGALGHAAFATDGSTTPCTCRRCAHRTSIHKASTIRTAQGGDAPEADRPRHCRQDDYLRRSFPVGLAPVLLPTLAYAVDNMSSPDAPDLTFVQAKIKAQDYAAALAELRDAEDTQQADVYNLPRLHPAKARRLHDFPDPLPKELELEPDHKVAREYLGELCVETGNMTKAKEQLDTLACFVRALRGTRRP
jgi:hypothetical protein